MALEALKNDKLSDEVIGSVYEKNLYLFIKMMNGKDIIKQLLIGK